MDRHPSPIEADSLGWLGIRAKMEQGEAVGVLWLLTLPPYLGGLPGVSGFLVGRGSILSSRYNHSTHQGLGTPWVLSRSLFHYIQEG